MCNTVSPVKTYRLGDGFELIDRNDRCSGRVYYIYQRNAGECGMCREGAVFTKNGHFKVADINHITEAELLKMMGGHREVFGPLIRKD